MSAKNPQIKNLDRPAYELPDLIKRLGDVSCFDPLTQEQRDMADAIQTHARNAHEVLLDGMESVGHLMTLAGGGDVELDNHHVLNLGALLQHLAVEANYLRAAESDMRCVIDEQEALQATAKSAVRAVPTR
jgi:hypothetical protein